MFFDCFECTFSPKNWYIFSYFLFLSFLSYNIRNKAFIDSFIICGLFNKSDRRSMGVCLVLSRWDSSGVNVHDKWKHSSETRVVANSGTTWGVSVHSMECLIRFAKLIMSSADFSFQNFISSSIFTIFSTTKKPVLFDFQQFRVFCDWGFLILYSPCHLFSLSKSS